MDEVKSPFCEASPDFCNWEHEYLMYNGLKALAPYAHTNVHAKYWNRWKDNDVKRSVKIMIDAGLPGHLRAGVRGRPVGRRRRREVPL